MKFSQLVLLLEADEGIEVKREYWNKAKKKLKVEEWYKDGKYHRLDGPAYQRWDKNGQKESEMYFKDGNIHRTDSPAYQQWYKNGQKESDVYYKDGKKHRLDGPAYQRWYKNGQKDCQVYYLYGKEVQPNEFKQLHKQYNSDDLDILDDLNS